MKKTISIFGIVALLTVGCIRKADSIKPAQVPPSKYEKLSCKQLNEKIIKANKALAVLSDRQDLESEKRTTAHWMAAIGFVVYDIGHDYEDDVARLKGEYQTLKEVAAKKNCGFTEVAHQTLSNKAAKYKKSCELNNGNACAKLGTLYCNGDGIKKDKNMCKQYLTKACDLNDARGCNDLGLYQIYHSTDNPLVYSNKRHEYNKKAMPYWVKACNLNHGGGCANLGNLYYFGDSIKQDYSEAIKYFKKGCDLDNTYGCSRYKELKSKGY